MSNIVRWFEDFPSRALDLIREFVPIAASADRIGSLSLLVAPALITAPYERLQTWANRRNPQADYLRFPEAHRQFDDVMRAPFAKAPFWTSDGRVTAQSWRCGQVATGIRQPSDWRTASGDPPWDAAFWSGQILEWETRRVWKSLRDSLAHWNVVTSDRQCRVFDDRGTMELLLFYRSDRDSGPWEVLAVPPDAFMAFLERWASFLAEGVAHEVLLATAME